MSQPGIDFRVALVDTSGVPLSVGSSTQYADGATQANPTGNVVLWLDTANALRAASAAKPLPMLQNLTATAHSANPTAATAGQPVSGLANRAGVPFVMGGHPNIITVTANLTAAQTDLALATIATGLKIVVTSLLVTASFANTVNVSVIVGFGTVNTPTLTANTPVAGVVGAHPNIAPGSGFGRGNGAGILGIGTDDQDLRITSSVPTGGSIDVIFSYYTIES